jgi:hypothetical protein
VYRILPHYGFSAGVAMREPGRGFDDRYSEADGALHAPKVSGRNQIRFPPALDALLRKIGAKADEPKPDPLARSA